MFWIFRRTGAANLFNSLNNNCNNSNNSNSHNTGNARPNNSSLLASYKIQRQEKYVKRPQRKAYGRLNAADFDVDVDDADEDDGEAEGDDAVPLQHKIDDPFDDPNGGKVNGNGVLAHLPSAQGIRSELECATVNAAPCTPVADGQGNFAASDLCDLNECGNDNVATNSRKWPVQLEAKQNQHIKRQQNPALPQVDQADVDVEHDEGLYDDDDDDDDEDELEYEESLTCNVCDRSFGTQRQLGSHQQKKRHFGCNACDNLYPSLMLLEHHKEEYEHWSEDEATRHSCCRRRRRNHDDDYFTDTDSDSSEAESEDQERLL